MPCIHWDVCPVFQLEKMKKKPPRAPLNSKFTTMRSLASSAVTNLLHMSPSMSFTSSFLGRNGPKRLWKNRRKSMGSPSLSDLHHSFAGKQLAIFTLDAPRCWIHQMENDALQPQIFIKSQTHPPRAGISNKTPILPVLPPLLGPQTMRNHDFGDFMLRMGL